MRATARRAGSERDAAACGGARRIIQEALASLRLSRVEPGTGRECVGVLTSEFMSVFPKAEPDTARAAPTQHLEAAPFSDGLVDGFGR